MFCPEGYLTLFEIYEILLEAGDNHARENLPPLFDKAPTSGFYIDTGDDLETMGRAYGEWLFQNFLWRFASDLCACQNTGVVVRLAASTSHSTKVFNGPFPDSIDGQKVLIKHVEDGLAWIDHYFFRISSRKSLLPEEDDRDDYGLKEMSIVLNPIDGWLVCWKPPKWPFRHEDLVQASSNWRPDGVDGTTPLTHKTMKRGRPPKGNGTIKRAVHN